MVSKRRRSVLFSVTFLVSVAACASRQPSQPVPPKTSESPEGSSCAEYSRALWDFRTQRELSDSAFFDLAASGEGDPVLEARRAVAAGDVRFIGYSIIVPGIVPAAYGVECRPDVPFEGEALVRTVFAGSDMIRPEEQMRSERRLGENFGHFGTVYNKTLLSDPHYPYRDICRPSRPGYSPHRPTSPPVPAEYGFRDLVPTDQPVDLGEAARRGTLQSMDKLIRSNHRALNRADDFGMTPLAWAIVYRREAHIARLLEAGADPAGAACSDMSYARSPMQLARTLQWRSLILKMRPMVPAARAERLFDKPVRDPAHSPDFTDLGDLLAGKRIVVTLSVNAQGRAVSCTTTRSSGDLSVDRRMCAVFVQRTRWLPARGEFGEPVAADVDTNLRGIPKEPGA